MFEDALTERARLAYLLARREARREEGGCLNTGHLLLGIVLEEDGLGAEILLRGGIDATRARTAAAEAADAAAGRGGAPQDDSPPLTRAALEVLEHALDEARWMGFEHAATEHVLLGLIRFGEGPVARTLLDASVTEQTVRETASRRGPKRR